MFYLSLSIITLSTCVRILKSMQSYLYVDVVYSKSTMINSKHSIETFEVGKSHKVSTKNFHILKYGGNNPTC
jgi:hypothetical protein